MPQLVENSCKLSLEIARQHGVCDRPTNNREVLGPSTLRLRTVELTREPPEAITDPLPIAVVRPTGCLLLECLPVLVACVLIADLCCVHDPWKRVVNPWRRDSDVGPDIGRKTPQLRGIETVFEGEDRLLGGARGSAQSEFIKMLVKPIVPIGERHRWAPRRV